MENPFAIGFYVISYFKLNPTTIINVLQLLENEAEDHPTDTIPFDFISPIIHQIYTSQNVFIRCSTLRIISFFEINSPTSIIEEYQFDKLVCMSIEQKPPDPPLKVDEEKVVSFRIVLLLIKMRHSIPVSIVRSLISLYYTPKHNFHSLIVSYLCQAILLCDEFPDVPEVSQVLVDHLIETGDQNLIEFFIYIFEKQFIFMNYPHFSSKLLSSLSGAFNQIVKLDQASNIVIKLLGSWPGLFSFGIKFKSIQKLVKTLPHFQTTIIKIFTKLLFLNSPKNSSMTGYTGFLLFYLIKQNLIDLLTSINSSNSETLTFLDQLLFYTSHYKNTSIITNDNINGFFNKGQILISNNLSYNDPSSSMKKQPSASSPLLKISQCLPSFQSLTANNQMWLSPPIPGAPSLPPSNTNSTSIPSFSSNNSMSQNNSFVLDQFSVQNLVNSDEINWKKVHILLTVVLPHDNQEAQSPSARLLYSKIFNYFCSRQVSDFPQDSYVIISECVFALFDLLLPQEGNIEHNSSYLFESKEFILAIINSLNLVVTPNLNIDDHHPVWSIIESFLKLMNIQIGIHIFTKHKMPNLLVDIGKKFSPTKSVERLLRMVQFYPEASFSTFFFSLFISSNSQGVVKIALNELRRKSKTTPNFYKQCLETTLLQFIRHSKVENNYAINLLCEMILNSEECLSIAAKDSTLHPIIKKYSREMYCVLLRNFVPRSKFVELDFNQIMDDEIDYWMKRGIFDYVSNFDMAAKSAFENKNEPVPSIIFVDGHSRIPPHLFGEISHNDEGLSKLTKRIPELLEILHLKPENSSIQKKRAALFALGHFCSLQRNSKPEIIQEMIDCALKSESYILIGTLIDCLSLVFASPPINEVLTKNGFSFFEFGDHICVIPISPECLINDSFEYNKTDHFSDDEKDSVTFEEEEDWNESVCELNIPSKIAVQLPLLLNPIHQTSSTQLLFKAANGEIKVDELVLSTENCLYAHELVSKCTFIPTARKFIFDIFRSTPLLAQRNDVIIDQEVLAECLARAEEAANASPMMLASSGFTDAKLPKFAASEIKLKKQKTIVPEVYLRDEEFGSMTGVPDRKSFYMLPHEQQNAIRNKLLL